MAKSAGEKRREELDMIRLMVGLYCKGNHHEADHVQLLPPLFSGGLRHQLTRPESIR